MRPQTLLCVANFPSNTGYAWDFIESLFARIADRFQAQQIRTFVAHSEIPSPPRTLRGSAAIPISLDATLETRQSVAATIDFIRQENVMVVYLTDRMTRDPAYLRLRWAGARHIVVHGHTGGEWTPPRGLKYGAKWLLARIPTINADEVVVVSDYVARRQLTVGLIPKNKVQRVWNGVPIPSAVPHRDSNLYRELGLSDSTPLILCACRARAMKGVPHLLRAFDLAMKTLSKGVVLPALLYVGDGPQFAEIQEICNSLTAKDRVFLTGYRSDVPRILEMADVCVVPSLGHDALPLSVLESLALGKPVIATRVGGVPEMIEHGRSGILVAPGDEESVAKAIVEILSNRTKAQQMAEQSRGQKPHALQPGDRLDYCCRRNSGRALRVR